MRRIHKMKIIATLTTIVAMALMFIFFSFADGASSHAGTRALTVAGGAMLVVMILGILFFAGLRLFEDK